MLADDNDSRREGESVGNRPFFQILGHAYRRIAGWLHALRHWDASAPAQRDLEPSDARLVTPDEDAAARRAARDVLKRVQERRGGEHDTP